MQFHVGDRVVCIKDNASYNQSLRVGMTGTVVHIDDENKESIGVRWDNTITAGHHCDRHCEYGYGWFVYNYEIELETDDLDDADVVTDSDIFSLLGIGGAADE